jgi:hypothetical protein
VPAMTLSTSVMRETTAQRPSILPVKYDQRRVRTVQKRTLRCWSSLDMRSNPRSAMRRGPSQTVILRKTRSDVGMLAA